jgi:hypothetical protein
MRQDPPDVAEVQRRQQLADVIATAAATAANATATAAAVASGGGVVIDKKGKSVKLQDLAGAVNDLQDSDSALADRVTKCEARLDALEKKALE